LAVILPQTTKIPFNGFEKLSMSELAMITGQNLNPALEAVDRSYIFFQLDFFRRRGSVSS
jgi:hypothetical protein